MKILFGYLCLSQIFESNIGDRAKITNLGYHWCKCVKQRISNHFWIDVLEAWITLCDKYIIKTQEIVSSPLWYNPKISPSILYFPHWYNKGIIYVSDLIKANSLEVFTIEELKKCITFHYTIKILVTKFIKSHVNDHQPFIQCERPFIPQHIAILYKNTKGSRDMYNVLNFSAVEPKMKQKWNRDLNKIIDKQTWQNTYKICFKTMQDTSIIWLQYRILFRILGTRQFLHKIKKSSTSSCRLCKENEETLIHMFDECEKVAPLRLNLKNLITDNRGINLFIDQLTILFGYHFTDSCIKL